MAEPKKSVFWVTSPLNWSEVAKCFQFLPGPRGSRQEGDLLNPFTWQSSSPCFYLHGHEKLCWFMEMKPSPRMQELPLNTGWALAGDLLASVCTPFPWLWLRLHHSLSFCEGRSRLSSTQLPIFPKPVGEEIPLDLFLSAEFYWKWLMISEIMRD